MSPRKPKYLHSKVYVDENSKIYIQQQIHDFLQNAENVLRFPETLTKDQRAWIHVYSRRFGLTSKSHGNDSKRYIAIHKKNEPTDIDDVIFEISDEVKNLIYSTIKKNPLTRREISDLIPKNLNSYKVRIPSYRFSVGVFSKGYLCIPPLSFNSKLQQARTNLPITPYRNEILQTLEYNQITVILGETGSGKTTQIPQYILEDCAVRNRPCRIFCTQPRRLSALSVADRVVYERGEIMGTTVGYQIRLESRTSPTSNLIYSTVGVFLRCLMSENQDAFFSTMTHIIVDEVHERDKYTDFLLTTLKRTIRNYPHIRLILMSATIESETFSKYFFDCPSLKLPGRMYDVQSYFLEDILSLLSMYDGKNQPSDDICNNIKEETVATVVLDRESICILNETLESCVNNPTECFHQFFYLIEGEHLPVDFRHTETDMSALMIAAGQGNIAIVKHLLVLGADPEMKSRHGLNSIEWASKLGQYECVNLLSSYIMETKTDPSHINVLLKTYQKHSNDEIVDIQLIFNIIKYIHTTQADGSILVFLPGYDDIIELNTIINRAIKDNELDTNVIIFMLHSSMGSTDQKGVFKKPPFGCRKVILSTNIAETSVTIDDVVYVIDSGKVKQKGFDSISGTTSLSSTWISQACATQRHGRAGRTCPGICYRIYSKYRFETMDKFTIPEILRIPLTDICLQAKLIAQNIPIAEFLAESIQPPTSHTIKQSIKILIAVGALDDNENLTDLGAQLVDLPVDVQLGKILIYSIILRCLDPVLSIVSALSVKDPFILPSDTSDRHRAAKIKIEFSENSYSDHMALLKLFQMWLNRKSSKTDKHFCYENYISSGNMETMCGVRSQILGYLRAVGLVQSQGAGNIHDVNKNSQNWALVKACFAAGLYPNICRTNHETGTLKSKLDKKVLIHKSSVLRAIKDNKNKYESNSLPTDWVVYGEKTRIGSMSYVRVNTLVTPLTIALFGGPINQSESQALTSYSQEDSLSDYEDMESAQTTAEWTRYQIDEWISFILPTETAYMVFNLRQKMNSLVLKFISNPRNYSKSELESNIVTTISEILSIEDALYSLSQPRGIGERPKAVALNLGTDLSCGSQEKNEYVKMTSAFTNANISSNGKPARSFAKSNKVHIQQYVQHRPITKAPNHNKVPKNDDKSSRQIRYFIVKAASRNQVMNVFGTDKWDFSSSILKKIFKISRANSSSEIIILFHVATTSEFVGIAKFILLPQRFRLDCFSSDIVKFSVVREYFANNKQGPSFHKSLDRCFDGEELSYELGTVFLELFDKKKESTNYQNRSDNDVTV